MKPTNEMTVSELTSEIDRLRQASGPAVTGKRAVFVIDKGWIFAGDASETADGYVRIDRAVWVFRWESVGFAAVVADPKKSKADIRPIAPVEVPKNAIVFRIPVGDSWGL